MKGAQVVDAEGKYPAPEGDVSYREMVVRRSLAGQTGSRGGRFSLVPGSWVEVAPGWRMKAPKGPVRVLHWAVEDRGQEGVQLWAWEGDEAASWHLEAWAYGQLPKHPELEWLAVERFKL